MTQAQLERAVCRATGESRDIVRRLGFQEMPMPKIVIARQFRPTTPAPRQRLVTVGK